MEIVGEIEKYFKGKNITVEDVTTSKFIYTLTLYVLSQQGQLEKTDKESIHTKTVLHMKYLGSISLHVLEAREDTDWKSPPA